MTTTKDLIVECTNKLFELAQNPVFKTYIDQQTEEHVDFEMIMGNSKALIGEWKYNSAGDLVTYIHAPRIAKVAIRELINKYGTPIVFASWQNYAILSLEEKIRVGELESNKE